MITRSVTSISSDGANAHPSAASAAITAPIGNGTRRSDAIDHATRREEKQTHAHEVRADDETDATRRRVQIRLHRGGATR